MNGKIAIGKGCKDFQFAFDISELSIRSRCKTKWVKDCSHYSCYTDIFHSDDRLSVLQGKGGELDFLTVLFLEEVRVPIEKGNVCLVGLRWKWV